MNKWDIATDLLKNKTAALGLGLILLVILTALIGPALAPFDPIAPAPLNRLQRPNNEHIFGTDGLGRDIFSRVILGHVFH